MEDVAEARAGEKVKNSFHGIIFFIEFPGKTLSLMVCFIEK